MAKISVTLTAYNMGPATTEADFDAWHSYVCDHIDSALGFEVHEVEQFAFVGSGAAEDQISGATEEQRDAIRTWLGVDGWDAFCSEHGADAA